MKIYCNRTELNKALNNVSHSVPVRTTSNILEGILVNAEADKMKLTSTDTNITTLKTATITMTNKHLALYSIFHETSLAVLAHTVLFSRDHWSRRTFRYICH